MQLAICTLAINGLLQSYIRAPPPRMMGAAQQREEAERKERLQQLFGKDFKDDVAKELARVKGVRQPEAPEAPPDWMVDPREGPKLDASDLEFGAKRMTLWLEDGGVNMEKILLVQAGERRLAVVTSRDVAAGETLFEVPDSLLLSADAAFAHPDVGRALRDMAAKQRVTTAGFETFAIATVLAVERVRRAAVKGVLKRQDDGILGVATGGASSVLPKWEVKDRGSAISNNAFNPFIASLEWPEEDECLVDSNEKAEAVRQGSQLIAKLIEPTSRTAWMKATQRQGLAQATSDEDCECTAMQALVLTMSTQLDPPPPLGQPNGMLGWGGKAREGPALCPLANLVIPPADVTEEATKAGTLDGLYNAQLGRPTTGSVDSADGSWFKRVYRSP